MTLHAAILIAANPLTPTRLRRHAEKQFHPLIRETRDRVQREETNARLRANFAQAPALSVATRADDVTNCYRVGQPGFWTGD